MSRNRISTRKRCSRLEMTQSEKVPANILIYRATSKPNPFESINIFNKYVTKDNQIIELSCFKIQDAQPECVSWIFDIMERNMKTLYEQSDWGWDPVAKQKELTEPTARYLVATFNKTYVGFCHFRFDIDDAVPVLYCYEIQLEPVIRKKGLGNFMMSVLECIAAENEMLKVVLTVFKHNPSAMQFFYSLGYEIDATSPREFDSVDYIILGKAVNSGTVRRVYENLFP